MSLNRKYSLFYLQEWYYQYFSLLFDINVYFIINQLSSIFSDSHWVNALGSKVNPRSDTKVLRYSKYLIPRYLQMFRYPKRYLLGGNISTTVASSFANIVAYKAAPWTPMIMSLRFMMSIWDWKSIPAKSYRFTSTFKEIWIFSAVSQNQIFYKRMVKSGSMHAQVL